jgi:peroxiredoxin (alkyl hydroperoxide reductase subunit C)
MDQAALPLKAGAPAPPFQLPCTSVTKVSLYEFLRRPVVLAFYPEDWSPASVDLLSMLQDFLTEISETGAAVVAVSIDGIWSHEAFARSYHLEFPLLSDARPRGEVARAYGVYDEAEDAAKRAIFVIDGCGRIASAEIYPPDLTPSARVILDGLNRLRG